MLGNDCFMASQKGHTFDFSNKESLISHLKSCTDEGWINASKSCFESGYNVVGKPSATVTGSPKINQEMEDKINLLCL